MTHVLWGDRDAIHIITSSDEGRSWSKLNRWEQYTFGGDRVSLRVEIDRDGEGSADADSGWREVYNGQNVLAVKSPAAGRWRLSSLLRSTDTSGAPEVSRLSVKVLSS